MDLKKISTGLHPEGWSPLGPDLFLRKSSILPIFDVRSPKEFSQGHIRGAISLPLFTDDERAIVGTTYAHEGKEQAILKGLEIVGPKLDQFVRTVKKIATKNEVLVHCWRGGMRSEAMAWLLQFAGIKTSVLSGGYKAYRHYIHDSFTSGPEILVIGGMTGSGKTEILRQLASKGEQVIDLEGLANHKGSAFGALGQEEQPTNEQFENDLAACWLMLDHQKPVYIEDESRNIGKVIIPGPVFEKMSQASVINIEMPFEERVNRLVKEYGIFEKADLISILEKIKKRVGGDVAMASIREVNEGQLERAISIILKYYDKTYQYGLSKRDTNRVFKVSYAEFCEDYRTLRL